MKNTQHAEIQTRAYFLWEMEGRPDGRHFDHWLRAEAELGKGTTGDGKEKPARRRKTATKKTA